MSNLRNLGTRFSVSITPDDDGYLGRECPVPECKGYFKITPGTGVQDRSTCRCPYCGQESGSQQFFTAAQREYARSVVMRKVTDAVHKDLKTLEFEHKPVGPFGIGISMKVKTSQPAPIRYYRESKLETEVVCDKCSLRYAIYGVFGWCPDCGSHNSLQILGKNLELVKKEIALSTTVEGELGAHLLGDALENAVSAFDGFGREVCAKASTTISFQNLGSARRKVKEAYAFDFADPVTPKDWDFVSTVFQKRHLLAHNMGVVDEEYLRKTNDPSAVVGRKVQISQEELNKATLTIEVVGRRLFEGIFSTTAGNE